MDESSYIIKKSKKGIIGVGNMHRRQDRDGWVMTAR